MQQPRYLWFFVKCCGVPTTRTPRFASGRALICLNTGALLKRASLKRKKFAGGRTRPSSACSAKVRLGGHTTSVCSTTSGIGPKIAGHASGAASSQQKRAMNMHSSLVFYGRHILRGRSSSLGVRMYGAFGKCFMFPVTRTLCRCCRADIKTS